MDGAFNGLVGMVIHNEILLFVEFGDSMAGTGKIILEKASCVAFYGVLWYAEKNGKRRIGYGENCPFYFVC